MFHELIQMISSDFWAAPLLAQWPLRKKRLFLRVVHSLMYTPLLILGNLQIDVPMYRTQQLELERLRKAQRRVGDFLKITFFMIHVKIFLVVIIMTNHHNHYNNQSSDNSWVWGKKPKGGHLHLRGDKMILRLC